jgi:hypothetical protein
MDEIRDGEEVNTQFWAAAMYASEQPRFLHGDVQA